MLHKHPSTPCTSSQLGIFVETNITHKPGHCLSSPTSNQQRLHALHDLSSSHALLTSSGFGTRGPVSQSVSCCSCTHRSTRSSIAQAAKSPHTCACMQAAGTATDQQPNQQQPRTYCWASHLYTERTSKHSPHPHTHIASTTLAPGPDRSRDSPLETSCQHHKAQPSHMCSYDKRLGSQHRQ